MVETGTPTLSSLTRKVENWLQNCSYASLVDPRPEIAVPVIERFDWSGHALDPGFRRVRVIGRQLYVLCHAALAGNQTAKPLAERVAATLLNYGIGSEGQFVCRLSADGAVLDPAADLYDVAFGLFALAWWYRLSGDEMVLLCAENIIHRMRKSMASPSGHGYLSRPDMCRGHEQNPHMHLFEAAIFLAQSSDRASFRMLSDELFALAEHCLFDPGSCTIAEQFDDAWQPVTAPDGTIQIEPGHQYEWVWLLHQYAALSGCERAFVMAEKLFLFARRNGHDAATGLILDGVSTCGRAVAQNLRIWPNTEFLKAQVAMRERYGTGPGFADCDLSDNVARIFRHYLDANLTMELMRRPGLWIDYLRADGITPNCDHVPASSLYHIVFGFSEFLRHMDKSVTAIGLDSVQVADAAILPLATLGDGQ